LLAYQLRSLAGTAERAGIDGPAGRVRQFIGKPPPHGDGLCLALVGQIGVATPLQTLLGIESGLAVAQQIDESGQDEPEGWPKQTCKRRRKKRVNTDPFAVNLARVNRLSPS